ncbi:hypothetical protein AB6A40_004620 [Gnathostoma spinigerum]|uniref:DNA-directed RNA polymerase III subunit RPC8 n=1 Tax=Gnathostoma spinigerum TaxID=75299 RepID=A0ABD6EFB1_9BILA
MFVLALIEDTVRIKPFEFGSPLEEVIKRRLNERLANKVVPDLGLCIVIHDLVEVGDSYVLPGDGSTHTHIKFRYIVFRPFVDEIIEAKVLSSSKEGLTLSVGFFEDIFIPSHRLPETSVYEEEEQVWYWEYPSEDGEPPAKLYMDPGKVVRFRVVENVFKDVDPDASNQDETKKECSYRITGSMMETGLGCVAWWTPPDENGEDDNEGEGEEMDEEGGDEAVE